VLNGKSNSCHKDTKRLAKPYQQFVVDLNRHVVFALQADGASFELRVASNKEGNHPISNPQRVTCNRKY